MRALYIIITMSILLFSCKKGKNNPDACNGSSTRRDIKICIDAGADDIDTSAIVIDVASLGNLDVPEAHKDIERQDIEKKIYTITAKVHKVSNYRDGDWKIKLTDGNDKFVNCESPNMGCEYIADSRFYDEMNTVREWVMENKDNLEGKTVTITGVAFIDIDHRYPRNAAENELEIHPILDIHF